MDLLKFFSRKQTSSTVAKDRLKLVLIHDRMNCSPELLEMIKSDIIEVISKYVDFDENELDIKIDQQKSEHSGSDIPILYANIPISNLRQNKKSS